MSIITLLTDFGTRDEYVASMKGVILTINPSATIVDITHTVDPQDVLGAAYLMRSCYGYFPKGSIHLSVVDPGVGSQRKIVALKSRGHVFLSPDNGLLSPIVESGPIESLRSVDNPALCLVSVSRTFHGRDIFAPVAAHLSLGLDIKEVGPPIVPTQLAHLEVPEVRHSTLGELVGTVVAVDRFGNLITNITETDFHRPCVAAKSAAPVFHLSDRSIRGLSNSYSSVPSGRPVAVIGSRGNLEIAVNGGDARRFFDADRGDTVTVTLERI